MGQTIKEYGMKCGSLGPGGGPVSILFLISFSVFSWELQLVASHLLSEQVNSSGAEAVYSYAERGQKDNNP